MAGERMRGGKPDAGGSVPIYCINLARSVERRQAMAEQAQRLGLDITFIEAVDGREIDPMTVPEYLHRERVKHGRPSLRPNEVACALSHKRALEAFLESEAPAAVILEDDTVFEPEFGTVVKAVLSETGSWDLVKLCRIKRGKTAHIPIQRVAQSFRLVAPLSTTQGNQAILYSRIGAARALRSLACFSEEVDTHIGRCWITGLKIVEVRPFVVRHAGVTSTIDAEGTLARERSEAPSTFRQRARRRLFRLMHSVLNPVCAANAALCVGLSGSRLRGTFDREANV
jgi:glycosyl transferase family 25